jgi:hypothetical protein
MITPTTEKEHVTVGAVELARRRRTQTAVTRQSGNILTSRCFFGHRGPYL